MSTFSTLGFDGVGAALLNSQQAATQQQVQVAVAKKAMEVQETTAMALIQALPSPPSGGAVNPPNLGNNVDIKA
ncbi:MAG: putative motility protein [Halothiobacillaceae bacterium]|jgi:hypothetical protein|nr:putative motility protein [Halothiobacillaceae bacterium]